VAVLAPSPAGATDVSATELARLARRVASHPGALAKLRGVTSVAGVPVDLRAALAGASPAALRRRLGALEAPTAARIGSSSNRDRQLAQTVLAQRRYREQQVPRPFAGLLRGLGRLLKPVGDAFGWLAQRLPGGDSSVWALLGAVVVAGAAAVSLRLGRRRSRVSQEHLRATKQQRLDERELERAADAAAARGDYGRAVRLRFVAGLLRLDRAGAIAFRPSLTTSEIEAMVSSAELEALTRSFDEITYGGRRARPEDLERARAGWQRLLLEVAR
jgi:hypothetical protein